MKNMEIFSFVSSLENPALKHWQLPSKAKVSFLNPHQRQQNLHLIPNVRYRFHACVPTYCHTFIYTGANT